jgi:hypothetical protein
MMDAGQGAAAGANVYVSPAARPKVARTLPKTVLRRNARKCPDLLNSSEFRTANGKKKLLREKWSRAAAHQLVAGRTFGNV